MNPACCAMRQARALLYRRCGGILSLNSATLAGFPEATAIPFCLDARGRPVFVLHGPFERPSANDARASLSLVDGCVHAGRLTLLGEAERVDDGDELTAGRFRRYFPSSAPQRQALVHAYFSLRPTHARFTDGAGVTRWLDPEELSLLNPVNAEDEGDFVRHMNRCHTAAMRGYCTRADILVPRDIEPAMAGIDALGFHLRLGGRFVRFEFRQPVTAVQEVRAEMLALTREMSSTALH